MLVLWARQETSYVDSVSKKFSLENNLQYLRRKISSKLFPRSGFVLSRPAQDVVYRTPTANSHARHRLSTGFSTSAAAFREKTLASRMVSSLGVGRGPHRSGPGASHERGGCPSSRPSERGGCPSSPEFSPPEFLATSFSPRWMSQFLSPLSDLQFLRNTQEVGVPVSSDGCPSLVLPVSFQSKGSRDGTSSRRA